MIKVNIPSDPFIHDWEVDFYPEDSNDYLVYFRDFCIHFCYKLYQNENEDEDDEEFWTAKILKYPSWFDPEDRIELYNAEEIEKDTWVCYTNKLYDFVWMFVIDICYY